MRLGVTPVSRCVATSPAQNCSGTQPAHRTAQRNVTAAPPSIASGSR
ncbi:molybdopterin biosynthesis protein [Xanthomonas citri]|nr:molybdopterin biosynthesis protein [Xanthomonas citri]